ncbi:hypothetical protein [Halorhabdus salina]|uniref:hypothetical protein n=1 Tax=Halorhabdus salina TaxID=2750670 RepID=UPI001C683AD4|nr:hypothetical protein [Halorhabdus salina]
MMHNRGRVTALWVTPDSPVSSEQTLSDHDIDLRYSSTVEAAMSSARDAGIDVVAVSGTLEEALGAVERLSTLDVP